jgi:hypothetical protein
MAMQDTDGMISIGARWWSFPGAQIDGTSTLPVQITRMGLECRLLTVVGRPRRLQSRRWAAKHSYTCFPKI